MVLWIVLGVVVLIIFYVIGVYNGLVKLRNRFKNSFSQIDVQLQRRYDLIPNLVETAKGYMKHEQETLEKVIQARNQALKAQQSVGGDPTQVAQMEQLGRAESQLTKSLTGFFALSESYPDLKANQNMAVLMEELSSTENKIAFSRQAYNDSVMDYNNGIEQFPASVFAGMFGFQGATQLELENPEARKAVKVSF